MKPEIPLAQRFARGVVWALPFIILIGLLLFLAGMVIGAEMRTSEIQAKWLSWYGERMSRSTMEPGANPHMRIRPSRPL